MDFDTCVENNTEEDTIKMDLYGIEYGHRYRGDNEYGAIDDIAYIDGDLKFFVENFITYTPEKLIAGLLEILSQIKSAPNGFYFIIGYMGEQEIFEEELVDLLDHGDYNYDLKFENGTFAVWKNENGDIVPLLPKEFTKFDTNRN